jgi:hypothetical protein
VSSGDLEQAKLAVKGLQARFSTSEGNEPTLVTGQAGAAGGVLRSTSELVTAMSDPKYKTDPPTGPMLRKNWQGQVFSNLTDSLNIWWKFFFRLKTGYGVADIISLKWL